MAKEVSITLVQQHIINRVRTIRLELGLTAEDLSIEVSPSKSITFIGNIESISSPATYTDHILNIIAAVFSEKSKLDGGQEYTIYDFYPELPVDDILQIKDRIDIPKESGPAGTVRAVLETQAFFDTPRTIKEITEYCNLIQQRTWKTTNFTSTLDYAVKKGQVQRIDLPGGGVKYQKSR